ncbi:hypothetical protein PanWU01x14_328110 [Parasponia andersonii]|uniref:Uncharacterized protein n=1 Tax=Parasponia andersonii TaxID=3476 RepID=A0A2P5AIT7_PARAD|nr:hypothetical protein PanWU01x14_328110 [Parasponia andersonii]
MKEMEGVGYHQEKAQAAPVFFFFFSFVTLVRYGSLTVNHSINEKEKVLAFY